MNQETQALPEAVRDFITPGHKKMLIGGKWVDAVSGKTFVTVNPATAEPLAMVAEGDAADIDRAVEAARKAFDEGPWPHEKPSQRTKVLLRIAELIEQHRDELAQLETLDNGKTLFESRNVDIPGAAETFRYYAGWPTKIYGETNPSDPSFFNYTLREPVGVCGQIIPWNFPLMMAAWKLGPALACGNTVVLKPAEQTPLTALRLGELLLEAGVPEGVVNIVPGFERESGYQVKAVAVGTGQALALVRKSEADVVLAHAPDTEKKYIADGTLIRRRLVMHNSFVLAGPAADPAKIKGTIKAVDALKKIVEAKTTFVSRGDDSGTHQLEKRLWEQAGIEPIGEWYLESGLGMGSTLKLAGEQQAYIIADRATYLACLKTTDLVVLVEDDQVFLNIYHVLEVNPEKFPKVHKGGKALADFLLSATVQDMLKMFGVDKFGEPLFYPDAGRTEVDLLQRQ